MTERNRRRDEHTEPRHNRRPRRDPTPAIDGPTPAAIGEALQTLVETPTNQTPKLSAIKTLKDAGIEFPMTVGDRRIMSVSITNGQVGKGSGHLRSDDHISLYEVEYPKKCPEDDCRGERERYRYSANHHIAGSEKTFCTMCETVHESEEWY